MQKAADSSAAFLVGLSAISNSVDRLRQPYLAPKCKTTADLYRQQQISS